MSQRVLLALAVALAGCGPSLQTAQKRAPIKAEAQAEFDAGVRLMRLGPENYESARERFAAAARLDPALWEAHFDLGFILQQEHRLDDAAAAYRRALDLEPKNERTRAALARALVAAGRVDAAISVLGEGLPRDAKEGGVDPPPLRARRIELAAVLRRAGKYDDAIAELRRVLRAEPRSASALVGLGLVYRARKQHELAELVLRRALAVEPKRAAAWNDLGLVLLAERRDQEAFAAFDKAVGLDPKLGAARYNRAAVYLDCGDYAAAAKELTQLTNSQPGEPDGWVALGVAERGQGHIDEARRAYERALTIDAKHAAALYNLGVLLMDFKKDPQGARAAFARYLGAGDDSRDRRTNAETRMKELDRVAPAAPPPAAPAPGAAK